MNKRVNQALKCISNSDEVFIKYLSSNDSGANGGHQAGIYIPKNSSRILFEDKLSKGKNEERFVNVKWQGDEEFKARFIYYGKSKDEYRITNFQGRDLKFKYLFILCKMNYKEYNAFQLDPEEADTILEYLELKPEDINKLFSGKELSIKGISDDEIDIKVLNAKLKDENHKIRPAGRHLLTIGRDLIKDNFAALVELVKNSYDADAKKVIISFSEIFENINDIESSRIKIIIEDDGHGMTNDTVINNWLVPSTDDKLRRKISPGKRIMQGRKGIGRYAASILGDDILLETCSNGEMTTLYIDWDEFNKKEFLDDVEILVENYSTNSKNGTRIEITGDNSYLDSWIESEIDNLIIELKKLLAPLESFQLKERFDIYLNFENFPAKKYANSKIKIEPFPILDLFDYRIYGTVTNNGLAKLTFENNSSQGIIPETYERTIKLNHAETHCGFLDIDLRVYDREPDAIQNLIDKGLKDPITQQNLGRNETKRLLNEHSGISIYRNGFRVRPYGDAGFDWLLLDKQRVQNPSMRIGSNQIIGFVSIGSEEKSHLEEKSARDGLKENSSYNGLIKIVRQSLNILEENRFIYRSKTGKGRSKVTTEEMVNSLFDYSDLKSRLKKEFESASIPEEIQNKFENIISDKEQANNKIADELKRKIIEYQGQVTLGKIVNVVLHEGRKPFMYFTNHIPLIRMQRKSIESEYKPEVLDSILKKVDEIAFHSEVLKELFSKIDPLAAKRREKKEHFRLLSTIQTVQSVFDEELKRESISFHLNCDQALEFDGWPHDFYITFTNLLENSVYWLSNNNGEHDKYIKINAFNESNKLIIEYKDNGPGIDPKFIEDDKIFEPGFTTKNSGTGLGLSIAGEAMYRNNCSLKVIENRNGAYFKIESK